MEDSEDEDMVEVAAGSAIWLPDVVTGPMVAGPSLEDQPQVVTKLVLIKDE